MGIRRRWWSDARWIDAVTVSFLLAGALCLGARAADGATPERVVVLTFDDASRSHATFVAPLLKKYGFGATFFICEFPPDFATDKAKYMTWGQIRSLHDMGFEIANHTRTHTHVDKMNRPELIEELAYIEDRCAEYGIAKPVSFAYPAYDTHPTALEVLRERGYGFARTGGSRPFRPGKDDPLLIPSFSTTGTDKERVLNAIRQADDGRIVVLTIHGVPDAAHPHVTTPPKLFEEYMQFLHDQHYTVIAMRDLARYVGSTEPTGGRIDRRALVTRHNIELSRPDPLTPRSVGNGEFAFTADITGLQTFPEFHEKGMPLGTQSQWGWHSLPNPERYDLSNVLDEYAVAGRKVPYAADGGFSGGYSPAGTWLRANPHRLHLGQIGLRLLKSDGSEAGIEDLTDTAQSLDLWTGLLTSRFQFGGQPVYVETVCHPHRDLLAVRVESPLMEAGLLTIKVAFPCGSTEWRNAADWSQPNRHSTVGRVADNGIELTRTLNGDRYHVRIAWSGGGQIEARSEQEYRITCRGRESVELVFAFSPVPISDSLPDFQGVRMAAADHWRSFWSGGGAIDFSACTDPRAAELERRVVLSQYLTAIQCAGSRPPQETGLVCNSWYGKYHLEMHWWHAVHFALWGRVNMLERSLPWYESILPRARATAQLQGYQGARWPKMVGRDGRESPSRVGVFLIWQQPHPIYYAELCYRARKDRETLERYRQIVFETAEFMASYPVWEEKNQRYILGPALIPAQESYGSDRARNLNPTFELAYWHWALDTAQKWRQRLGLDREPKWDQVMQRLSKPHVREGVYAGIETPPYTIYRDHPSMVAALGVVPATGLIDVETMKRTYDHVLARWDWPSTWGWDYPMLAMTAARLGEPEKAVDALFLDSQKNRYLANGHNYQSARLPLYLPGNGGLLTAVAMMAAGWDGCPDRQTPGFPDNGKWHVRWEGLRRAP